MRDFLDNLIERHQDAAPRIRPRLPSMFEPEISHGGWDIPAPEMEEADASIATQVSIPTAFPKVIEPVQKKAAPAQSVHPGEEKPYGKAGLHESAFSPSRRVPPTLPPSQERGEARMGKVNSEKKTGLNEVKDGVSHAYQQGRRMEHKSHNLRATADEQTSVMKRVPVSSLPVPRVPTIHSPSRRNHGLLNPSATPIEPIISSADGSEQDISKPEPVINVTIGRIEVRATPASVQQVKKRHSTPPAMTLDEYLQKRNQGDRQ